MRRKKTLLSNSISPKKTSSEAKLQASIIATYPDELQHFCQTLCEHCYFQKNVCKYKKMLPVTSKGEPCPYFQKTTA